MPVCWVFVQRFAGRPLAPLLGFLGLGLCFCGHVVCLACLSGAAVVLSLCLRVVPVGVQAGQWVCLFLVLLLLED